MERFIVDNRYLTIIVFSGTIRYRFDIVINEKHDGFDGRLLSEAETGVYDSK